MHWKKIHENHVEAGERWESGACHQCFQIPHSDIPAPGIPFDWSILTVYVNHINSLHGQRKNIVRVWTPSFTAHLDILTCHFDTFFWKWADWGVCKDAYRLSAPLLSFCHFTLARFFTACLLFCLSALTDSLAQVKRT